MTRTTPALDFQGQDQLKINIAWISCQQELENPKETARGNYANYAKLENILKDCMPILNKHGFSLSQTVDMHGDHPWMTTYLTYRSGEVIKTTIPIQGTFPDMMKFGAGLTYARRYSLCMLLGIEGEKDLDGEKISAKDLDDLYLLSQKIGMTEEQAVAILKKFYDYESPQSIDSINFGRIKKMFSAWTPPKKA